MYKLRLLLAFWLAIAAIGASADNIPEEVVMRVTTAPRVPASQTTAPQVTTDSVI